MHFWGYNTDVEKKSCKIYQLFEFYIEQMNYTIVTIVLPNLPNEFQSFAKLSGIAHKNSTNT